VGVAQRAAMEAAAVIGTDGTKNSDEMKDLDNYAKKLLKILPNNGLLYLKH
jgi:hypothetical protein